MEETRTAAARVAGETRTKVGRKTPNRKSEASPKKPAKTAAPAKPRAQKPKVAAPLPSFQSTDREEWIRVAAYFRAERRGFVPGHELDDWIEAESALPVDEEGTEAGAKRRARPRKQDATSPAVRA